MYIVAEIPARKGSKRIPRKNLKDICGKPLIQYVIDATKKSKYINEIYVNTDSEEIGSIALHNEIKYYKRKPELAEDNIVSDQFNYDFIKHINPDILVMVNPVSPLITVDDIDGVIEYMVDNAFDTVLTVKEEKLQSFYKNEPINFDVKKLLPQTQNIQPIQICSWSICAWNCKKFIKKYEKDGHAVFNGHIGFYPLSPLRSVKISTIEDFHLCEALLDYREKNEKI